MLWKNKCLRGMSPKVDNFIDIRIRLLKCFKHKVGEKHNVNILDIKKQVVISIITFWVQRIIFQIGLEVNLISYIFGRSCIERIM